MSSIFVVAFDPPQADPVRTSLLYYWKPPQDTTSSAVETNQHFVPRFAQPQFNVLGLLRQQQDWASSATVAAQPETNTHFIGRFSQPQFSRFNYNTAAFDFSSSAVETNVHFIGRFTAPRFTVIAPFSGANDIATVPETNTHFIAKFAPVLHNVLPLLRSNIAADFSSSAVETNVHFIGRFTQPLFNVLPALRQTTAQDFSTIPPAITLLLRPLMGIGL